MSYFRITTITPANIPHSVQTVLLNDNKITHLAPYTFFEKTDLRKVDLSVNKMSEIERYDR